MKPDKNFWYGVEVEFSAAHFYHQPLWTAEKNKETFGLCYSKFGHGHDYKLRVEVLFEENFKIKLSEFQNLVKKSSQNIKIHLDHKHLNHEILEFKNLIPTSENIASYCHRLFATNLSEKLNSVPKIKIQLNETENIGAIIN